MKIFNILCNLVRHCNENLNVAKSYSDTNLTAAKTYANSRSKDLVLIKLFTSESFSLPANSAKNVTINLTTPSGYKVVDVVNARTNGEVFPVYASGLSSTTQASTWVRNVLSSAKTITITVFVLYIKTGG